MSDGDAAEHLSDDVDYLHGGVANAGAVFRRGEELIRPANPNSAAIHQVLRALHERGFRGASQPLGIDDEGRERMRFVPGDVPIPPYPRWAQSDEALASVARLIRRFHDAARQIDLPDDAPWSDDMADPLAADTPRAELVLCHNDVCMENVVFRDGEAVALLDFDFAAPGRAEYDLAQFARMCVPVDDAEAAALLGWRAVDVAGRLRVVADAYGLDSAHRVSFLAAVGDGIERGGQFVLRKVHAGDANFIAMWEAMGGMARFDRRRAWFAANHDVIAAALV